MGDQELSGRGGPRSTGRLVARRSTAPTVSPGRSGGVSCGASPVDVGGSAPPPAPPVGADASASTNAGGPGTGRAGASGRCPVTAVLAARARSDARPSDVPWAPPRVTVAGTDVDGAGEVREAGGAFGPPGWMVPPCRAGTRGPGWSTWPGGGGLLRGRRQRDGRRQGQWNGRRQRHGQVDDCGRHGQGDGQLHLDHIVHRNLGGLRRGGDLHQRETRRRSVGMGGVGAQSRAERHRADCHRGEAVPQPHQTQAAGSGVASPARSGSPVRCRWPSGCRSYPAVPSMCGFLPRETGAYTFCRYLE